MKIPDYNKKIKHPTYLKMQEEIKRLKEEYMILQNASDKVEEEKNKEIERLKEDIRVFKFTIKTQQEQIQELIAREEKTIEYIENNSQIYIDTRGEELEEIDEFNNLCKPSKLLDILKGSDKE